MEYYSITLPNVTPVKLVTGKANYGIGFLTAFVGVFCSLFGIPNNLFEEKIKKAEVLAIEELTASAETIGSDGVMDVRCQIDGLSFMVCGTAYKASSKEGTKEIPIASEPTISKASETSNEEKENWTDTTTFSTTEKGTIICSQCNFEQPGNRICCWHCGAKFENE